MESPSSIAAAAARLTNRSGTDELQRVVDRFADIAAGLGMAADAVDPIRQDLQQRLAADRTDEGLFTDTLKAAGEANCARLVADYLRSMGAEAHYVDPAEAGMILSDESGNARVLRPAYGRLRSLRERPGIIIFPGFVGSDARGRLVTQLHTEPNQWMCDYTPLRNKSPHDPWYRECLFSYLCRKAMYSLHKW